MPTRTSVVLVLLIMGVGTSLSISSADAAATEPRLLFTRYGCEDDPVLRSRAASPPPCETVSDIFSVSLRGRDRRRFTRSGRFGAATPTVSRAGGRIAFTHRGNIYVKNADGTSLRQLTRKGGYDPSWSPSGRSIVFVREVPFPRHPSRSDYDNPRYEVQLFVLRLGSGRPARRLTRLGGDSPAWSPDGKRIAYRRPIKGGNYSSIRWITPNGRGSERLVSPRSYPVGPAWSPTGDRLVFSTNELWILRLRGRRFRRITPAGSFDHFADWQLSPTGQVAFIRGVLGPDGFIDRDEIFAINPDGSGLRQLTNEPAWSSGVQSGIEDPKWLP